MATPIVHKWNTYECTNMLSLKKQLVCGRKFTFKSDYDWHIRNQPSSWHVRWPEYRSTKNAERVFKNTGEKLYPLVEY